MPSGERQENPGAHRHAHARHEDPFHTHRFPVTVYVLEGSFTLEMEGRDPMTVSAGKSWVEPPGVRMIGHNGGDGPVKVIIFYVSDPDTPFLDAVQQ